MKKLMLIILALSVWATAIGCVDLPMVKKDVDPPLYGPVIQTEVEGVSYRQMTKIEYTRRFLIKGLWGKEALLITTALMQVEGVQRIVPDYYDYLVIIAEAYSWDEVQPRVDKALGEVRQKIENTSIEPAADPKKREQGI